MSLYCTLFRRTKSDINWFRSVLYSRHVCETRFSNCKWNIVWLSLTHTQKSYLRFPKHPFLSLLALVDYTEAMVLNNFSIWPFRFSVCALLYHLCRLFTTAAESFTFKSPLFCCVATRLHHNHRAAARSTEYLFPLQYLASLCMLDHHRGTYKMCYRKSHTRHPDTSWIFVTGARNCIRTSPTVILSILHKGTVEYEVQF